MQPEKSQILWRLQCIEGHLQAVIGMIEQDQPIDQVVCQLLAIRGSAESLLSLLIEQQVQYSLDTLGSITCPELQAQEIRRLVSLYQIYSK
jgi:DNA-binding FrmR family transcriptional regulator